MEGFDEAVADEDEAFVSAPAPLPVPEVVLDFFCLPSD